MNKCDNPALVLVVLVVLAALTSISCTSTVKSEHSEVPQASDVDDNNRSSGGPPPLVVESDAPLLLDEPTSHLDIESIRVLEDLLASFRGGYIAISHDRTFVSEVADKLYYLQSGRLRLV